MNQTIQGVETLQKSTRRKGFGSEISRSVWLSTLSGLRIHKTRTTYRRKRCRSTSKEDTELPARHCVLCILLRRKSMLQWEVHIRLSLVMLLSSSHCCTLQLRVYTFALRLPHSFVPNLANVQSMAELVCLCEERDASRSDPASISQKKNRTKTKSSTYSVAWTAYCEYVEYIYYFRRFPEMIRGRSVRFQCVSVKAQRLPPRPLRNILRVCADYQ